MNPKINYIYKENNMEDIKEISYEKGPSSKTRLGPASITITATLEEENEEGGHWRIQIDGQNISDSDVMHVIKAAQDVTMKKMYPDYFTPDGKPDIEKMLVKLTADLLNNSSETKND